MMHKCPKCGTEFEGKFCPECGKAWQEEKTCPQCGAKLAGSAKFCNECGYSFTQQPPEPEETRPKRTPEAVKEQMVKRLTLVTVLPMILLGVLAVLVPLFFLAPVAVMPGGSFLGETIPSESYGNVYQSENYIGSSLSASLTAMIVLMACLLVIAFILGIFSLFATTRKARFSSFGGIYVRTLVTIAGYAILLALAVVSCVLFAQISQEDGGLGIFKAGAAPILTLVFSLSGCIAGIVCAIIGKNLRAYPSVAAAREARIAEAKPTALEVWAGSHKKATKVIIAVLVLVIAAGIAVPVALVNRYNGVYYAYNCETEEYDKTRFYKLTGSTWEGVDGTKGEIAFDGDKVTLTYDPSGGKDPTGMSAVTQEGEIHGDILKINGTVYAKEGHRHNYQKGICACGQNSGWKLEYTLNKEETEYIVTGVGTFEGTDLYIPSEYHGKPVTRIGSDAFSCRSLTNITISAGVTSIGDWAFWDCNSLTSIIIPESVTSIEGFAFEDCDSLQKVYYGGTKKDWDTIEIKKSSNSSLTKATRYYFSDGAPSEEQWTEWNYWWHFDAETGEVVEWKKENQ